MQCPHNLVCGGESCLPNITETNIICHTECIVLSLHLLVCLILCFVDHAVVRSEELEKLPSAVLASATWPSAFESIVFISERVLVLHKVICLPLSFVPMSQSIFNELFWFAMLDFIPDVFCSTLVCVCVCVCVCVGDDDEDLILYFPASGLLQCC